ncbi:amino acid aminotransferase [Candidatus Enterovibrio escicola]|uniref:Aminotransferase n=2 Tax=Candidatus Enterovibrio escicola TaxID=1927127 RepID=A0A2A5T142_9GAMM|nr:amino acid aminotransferase [Candidatus Enterovibrio escacola]PCS21838.1 Aspartate aminotransferase [Candidatus Enterovibrio escacola]
MFEKIKAAPADQILGLAEEFKTDPRTDKINLGVGIYKDESGYTQVLATVKKAETILLEKETTKSYLSILGIPEYGLAVQKLLFGDNTTLTDDKRIQIAQTPGGTGALRLAAEFIKCQLGSAKVWVSNPTWVNHNGIFTAAHLEIAEYSYYNSETKDIDFVAMMTHLETASAGDIVLLHGCCHNPTGIDPNNVQWQKLANLCNEKNLLPMFDLAYQGFAFGLEEDVAGLRIFANTCPELLVASSFSKNFGLYNERVGAFTLIGRNDQEAATAFSQVKSIARVIYSNPPAHGAAIVTKILCDETLRTEWVQEVTDMRLRIKAMRELFVTTIRRESVGTDFSFMGRQNGMFSFFGLNKGQVTRLKDEFGIYIINSGRISVAGMTQSNMDLLCKAIVAVI